MLLLLLCLSFGQLPVGVRGETSLAEGSKHDWGVELIEAYISCSESCVDFVDFVESSLDVFLFFSAGVAGFGLFIHINNKFY